MVLLAKTLGMERGEYAFIAYNQLPGDPVLGDFSWKRGDNLDQVDFTCTDIFRSFSLWKDLIPPDWK